MPTNYPTVYNPVYGQRFGPQRQPRPSLDQEVRARIGRRPTASPRTDFVNDATQPKGATARPAAATAQKPGVIAKLGRGAVKLGKGVGGVSALTTGVALADLLGNAVAEPLLSASERKHDIRGPQLIADSQNPGPRLAGVLAEQARRKLFESSGNNAAASQTFVPLASGSIPSSQPALAAPSTQAPVAVAEEEDVPRYPLEDEIPRPGSGFIKNNQTGRVINVGGRARQVSPGAIERLGKQGVSLDQINRFVEGGDPQPITSRPYNQAGTPFGRSVGSAISALGGLKSAAAQTSRERKDAREAGDPNRVLNEIKIAAIQNLLKRGGEQGDGVIRSLAGVETQSGKDRYLVVPGGEELDANSNAFRRPSFVFDSSIGKRVSLDEGGAGTANASSATGGQLPNNVTPELAKVNAIRLAKANPGNLAEVNAIMRQFGLGELKAEDLK